MNYLKPGKTKKAQIKKLNFNKQSNKIKIHLSLFPIVEKYRLKSWCYADGLKNFQIAQSAGKFLLRPKLHTKLLSKYPQLGKQ